MEKKAWDEKRRPGQEQKISKEKEENCLRDAVCKIVPDDGAKERIIERAKAGKRSRRRPAPRISAAVFAVCLFLAFLCLVKPGVVGEEVVVYAATEEHGWQKLVEGERILLKMEPFEIPEEGEDIEPFDDMGRCTYYPYICTFRLEMPENYLYDKQFITLRDDFIGERGGRIEWLVAPERPEDAGQIFQGELSLWIVDEDRVRMGRLELEFTKEGGKCYAELKRVWESEVCKKRKHKS